MRPTDLPRLRDQTHRHLADPSSVVRASTGSDAQGWLDGLGEQLLDAGLYWVRPDMAALAVSAGTTLDETDWGLHARPSACGLIVFEEGVGHAEFGADVAPARDFDSAFPKVSVREVLGDTIPVDACSWGSYYGECLVWILITRRRFQSLAPLAIDAEKVSPLIPIGCVPIPTGAPVRPEAFDDGKYRTVLAALAASWLLMEQPTLVDRVVERPDRPVRRAYARAGRPPPEVTLVDLRRQYVPDGQGPGDDGEGRWYRHRFVVSGHWRQQPYGEGRALRRRQWIPSHVKGPDGAPMLVAERVNVWRR